MRKTKVCFRCGRRKSLDSYYKHPKMGDGHLNKCKECTRRDVSENRSKRIGYYRAYDRTRGNRQTAEYRRRYKETNPIKTGARVMIGNAIRDGKIMKPQKCEECGYKTRLHGHHDDYAKPLEVRWLCSACHHQWHAIHGSGANG